MLQMALAYARQGVVVRQKAGGQVVRGSAVPQMGVAALALAAKGRTVLAVYEPNGNGGCSCTDPKCQHPGKHPRTAHGVLDATTD